MRILAAYRALQTPFPAGMDRGPVSSPTPAPPIATRIRQYFDRFQEGGADALADAVILTSSGYRIRTDRCYYDVFSDPLRELLRRHDMNTIVWEHGGTSVPRCSSSARISPILGTLMSSTAARGPLQQPVWFGDYQELTGCLCNEPLDWPSLEQQILHLQQRSLLFEQWLRRAGARLLVNVCWYDPIAMAATLAARRCGIPAIDYQHGLQDESHIAYVGWDRAPAGGFELVPDFFWCWGENQAERLHRANPAFERHSATLAGGFQWFNLCRAGEMPFLSKEFKEARRHFANDSRIILVTLQKNTDFHAPIIAAMAFSPPEWRWLVRFHRGSDEAEKAALRILYRKEGGGRAEFGLANECALYTLLRFADVHVTGHSTCCLEALGFGVPTVTVSKEGRRAFRSLIEQGVVFHAENEGALLAGINALAAVAAQRCRDTVETTFAPASAGDAALRTLLAAVRDRRGTA